MDEFALYFALNEIGGSDKSSSANDFMRFYEPFLHRFGDSASLLEIGVRFGSSLATWSLWSPRGQILGVDIDHQAGLRTQLIARGANTTGNVRVRILDVTSQELIRLTDYKPFDIIVDDGPHYFESQKHVFETLFPASLAPGGVYIVEDFAPDTFVYFQGIATAILRDEANGKKLQFLSKYSFDNLIKSDWRRSVKGVFFGSFSIVVTKWAMFNADAVWS